MKKIVFLLFIFIGISLAIAQNKNIKVDTLTRTIFVEVDDSVKEVKQTVIVSNNTIHLRGMEIVLQDGDDCPSHTYNMRGECIELDPQPDKNILKMVEEKGIKWNDSLKEKMTSEFFDYASIVRSPVNSSHWLDPQTPEGKTVHALYIKRSTEGKVKPWENANDKNFFVKMGGYLFNRDTKNKNYEARGIAFLAMNSITTSVIVHMNMSDGKKLEKYANNQSSLSLTEKMSIVYNDFCDQIKFIDDNSTGVNKNLIMKVAVAKALTELINDPDVLVSTYGNWFWNFQLKK